MLGLKHTPNYNIIKPRHKQLALDLAQVLTASDAFARNAKRLTVIEVISRGDPHPYVTVFVDIPDTPTRTRRQNRAVGSAERLDILRGDEPIARNKRGRRRCSNLAHKSS